MREHRYEAEVVWTGDRGEGTATFRGYDRSHDIRVEGKAVLAGSSDPGFRGDPSRHNPEELLVASLSACHMLWYLHLCSANGVVVTAYEDRARGLMAEEADGGGRFREVVLEPRVTVAATEMVAPAEAQHDPARALCFIARSVNFPVRHAPSVLVR